MKSIITLLLTAIVAHATPLVYQGETGFGVGKHIVFLASDHEYRSEEACPALARILAKRMGFKCTVIFGEDQEGFIQAGSSHVSGLEVLEKADLFFVFARFLDLPEKEMAHIENYLVRGGPVVGLRTSSHAFKIAADSKYAKYDYRSMSAEYEKGFGHQVLGNTWIGHYGENHKQGTRITTNPEQRSHVILKGVGTSAFGFAGAYVGKAAADFTVLANSQPLVTMDPTAEPDANKPPVPCTWTRSYTAKDGSQHRVFHSTQGASQDFLDHNYRRMILNGVIWAIGMEKEIAPNLDFSFVGPYEPNSFRMAGYVKKVKPSDLVSLDCPIMPKPTESNQTE